jgi:hypothetical protein
MSKLLCAALMLVMACTAEKPRDERPINQAPPPQLEPPPVEPTTPTPEPSLEPAPVMKEWWCLCYRQEGAVGTEPVTECRELESQCRELQQRAHKDTDDIITGSLIQSCRSMTGGHPGDVAGTREQWQPSELPGAWVSGGSCLLAEQQGEHMLMHNEWIGDFSIGLGSAEIRSRHGEPDTRGAIVELGAIGLYEQQWKFGEGLTLVMWSTTRSGPQDVWGVTVVAPSALATRRGVVIGSEREVVERAYGDVRDREHGLGPTYFVAGSIHGGLVFTFDDENKVTAMFLGEWDVD